MINWNTDEKRLKKLHPKEYKLWRPERGLLPDRSNFWSWYAKNRTRGLIFV